MSSENTEPTPLEIESFLHEIQLSVNVEKAQEYDFATKLEKHFKVPVKCCDYCFWMDGFTGECALEFDNGTPYTAEERKKCPYPDAYRFGHGALMDNHDIMRDGLAHTAARQDHVIWMTKARLFRKQFNGKYYGVK